MLDSSGYGCSLISLLASDSFMRNRQLKGKSGSFKSVVDFVAY